MKTRKTREAEMKVKWLVVFCFLSLFSLVGLPKVYAEGEESDVPEGVQEHRDAVDQRTEEFRETLDANREDLQQHTLDTINNNPNLTDEQKADLTEWWQKQWERRDQKIEDRQALLDELKEKYREAQDARAEHRKEVGEKIKAAHDARTERIKEHLENVEAKKEELGTPPGIKVKPVNPPGPVGGPGAGPKVNPPGPKGGPGAGVPSAVKADRTEDVLDKAENVVDKREDVRDKREDIRDRREDIYDATHNAPVGTEAWKRDKAEDVLDRAEDVADRREDRRDRREDVRDRREDRKDRGNQGVFKGGKVDSSDNSQLKRNKIDKKHPNPTGKNIKKLNNPNPTAGIKKVNTNALKGKVSGAKNMGGGLGGGKAKRK